MQTKTLCINMFAGPGAGKTTAAWGVASLLKLSGLCVEYVGEYAKELVWDGKYELLDGSLKNQIGIFEEQARRLERLNGKVDAIVTDSPLPLRLVYGKENTEHFRDTVMQAFERCDSVNFFISRADRPFEQRGRLQNLEESMQKDLEIYDLLQQCEIPFSIYSASQLEEMAAIAVNEIQRINQQMLLEL